MRELSLIREVFLRLVHRDEERLYLELEEATFGFLVAHKHLSQTVFLILLSSVYDRCF